ncbi:MAG: NmrA/HSCARG family protein [Candidatus Bathyarchaeia archaeon]|jgi:uncharacterized protein YbjT (DUF2867 family)
MRKTILVIGATGHQGGAVVEALLRTDFSVRTMVRDMGSDKAQPLKKRGVEMVLGDLDDYDSLIHSMDGAYGAFSMLNFMDAGVQKEEERGKRVAEAAKEAAVQHFIYSSVGGAERSTGIPHFESKWHVEQHIRELELPYSIVRPTTFMTNLMESPANMRFGAFSMMRGEKMKPLQMIAVQDIGKWVAHMFLNRERFLGKAVEIAGDEVDFTKMATAYKKVYGKTPMDVQPPQPSPPSRPTLPFGDFEKMFTWINTYGYKADLEMNRREIPDLLTYEQFIALKKPL